MGLLLSALLAGAGTLEGAAWLRAWARLLLGALPRLSAPERERLLRRYAAALRASQAAPEPPVDWRTQDRGYLQLAGGREAGPLEAKIKFYGGQDSAAILFSTKISSFGQESIENEKDASPPLELSPERNGTVTVQTPQSPSFRLEASARRAEEDDEPKEKIRWHYRPLTPVEDSALPEIHFDSYERKSSREDDEEEPKPSEDFLRSLDGVKFRPLQRDDGSGRRRSFKKRHSSSSLSSRESRASREEELLQFTSLEEGEQGGPGGPGLGGSAPSLGPAAAERRSRSRSRTSPASSLSLEDRHELPPNDSFDEASELQAEEAEEAAGEQGARSVIG